MIARHAKPPVPLPLECFSHIHFNLVGPLPLDEGDVHALTVIDRTTPRAEAILLMDSKVETVTSVIIQKWIAWLRLPKIITSDRGVQLRS